MYSIYVWHWNQDNFNLFFKPKSKDSCKIEKPPNIGFKFLPLLNVHRNNSKHILQNKTGLDPPTLHKNTQMYPSVCMDYFRYL